MKLEGKVPKLRRLAIIWISRWWWRYFKGLSSLCYYLSGWKRV